MTTAHRPTFDPARGREAQRGPAYHQRLLPAHTHLKHRKAGQGGIGGLSTASGTTTSKAETERGDLRTELLQAEAAVKARREADSKDPDHAKQQAQASKRGLADESGEVEDANGEGGGDSEAKRRRLILEEAREIDADSEAESSQSDKDESSEEDDEEDDDDEEAELMRELAKIKAERAAAKAAEEEAKAKEDQEQHEYDIARGNPLLNRQDFGVKRRWDDDVVFRNQARGTEDKGKRKEFVNDLLRSDFHKKFMTRYVR